jgi:hypothetical protein
VSPKAKAATEAATEGDASLKRLPGVGWQTRDGRFSIETASGTWSVTDAEQTDDLGLPLVRGPFRSLTEAKAAIETARSSGPATSSLTPRATDVTSKAAAKPGAAAPEAPAKPSRAKPRQQEEPAEPRWISELDAGDRRRARQLLRRLEDAGAGDVEGVVRRDLVGDVPTVARFAVARRLAAGLADADPAVVKAAGRLLDVLADGRDEDLDVRWRLVDEAGRPIGITAGDVAAALKRSKRDA